MNENVGWVSPICKRGISPFVVICPCNEGVSIQMNLKLSPPIWAGSPPPKDTPVVDE